MDDILFLQYPKCSTCQKAKKWLQSNSIEVSSRNIVDEKPTEEELTRWISISEVPVAKFFNTSGKLYRENNLKDKVKTESDAELIKLLATNGMLVKRPLFIGKNFVLIGFKEDEWKKLLIK